jgi:AraC-like DNA-binding protein
VSKQAGRLRALELLHLAPVILVYVLTAPIFFYSGEEKIAFLHNMIRGIQAPLFSVFNGFIPVQGIVYTVLTIKTVADYNRRIKESFSTIDLINLNWLKYLTLGMIVIWSIVALNAAARLLMPPLARIDAMVNVPLALLIYSIGYMGLRQPEIFIDPSSPQPEDRGAAKYRRSGLSDDAAEAIKRRLIALMESERLFLGQDLTLQKLAGRLNTSSHNLSEVINTRLHLSYYDFVNQYRVEEFKSRLADPASERYNLLSIALESGFQSKGAFNAIFKKFTGMTPSEYKERVSASPSGATARPEEAD